MLYLIRGDTGRLRLSRLLVREGVRRSAYAIPNPADEADGGRTPPACAWPSAARREGMRRHEKGMEGWGYGEIR